MSPRREVVTDASHKTDLYIVSPRFTRGRTLKKVVRCSYSKYLILITFYRGFKALENKFDQNKKSARMQFEKISVYCFTSYSSAKHVKRCIRFQF